jgi:hypothetical protein
MGDAGLPPFPPPPDPPSGSLPGPPPGSFLPNAPGTGDVPDGNWQIRPPGDLDAVGIVGQGLALWRRIAVAGFLIVFLLQGLPTVLAVAIDGHVCDGFAQGFSFDVDTGSGGGFGAGCQPGPASGLVGIAVLFVYPLIFVGLLRLTTGSAVDPAEPSFGRGVGHAGRRYGPALVIGLAVVLTTIGLAIPLGIAIAIVAESAPILAVVFVLAWLAWYALLIALVYEAFLLEDVRGFRPIGRSWALTRRRFLASLGSLVLYVLIALALTFARVAVPQATLDDEGFGAVLQSLTTAIATSITTPMFAGVITTLYLQRRTEEEGRPLSPAWVRAMLARYDAA